ncbi:MAG TPA: hypothetical protein VMW64_06280 [Dehalococcoidia bacterium]|nr:hypothetical protein [Dehalococcoidia bacterium]
MKGRLGKFGLIFLALALCLSITGAAFAHWEKVVTIDGTVTTGTLDLIPSGDIWADQEKSVAIVNCIVDEAANTVSYTVGNAYPCLWVHGMFDLHNVGTVPAGLHDVIITPPAGLTLVWISGPPDCYGVWEGNELIATLCVTFVDPWENWGQIDAGDEVVANWALHFEEGLAQGAEYTFTVGYVYYNWNEA